MTSKIGACLWFDGQAEDAAKFYTSIFKDGKITHMQRYPDEGTEIHGRQPGSAMVVSFQLNGLSFTALNGGPQHKFNEAISFLIDCADQAEVDYFWEKLTEGGDPKKQQCGWAEDKFGVSWQIVPKILAEMIANPDPEKSRRAFLAMLNMKKMDIAGLQRACEG
jgi:predicted 3-demethylubiquinone-9 3-methyltransferase (glyoxalase superfamily)